MYVQGSALGSYLGSLLGSRAKQDENLTTTEDTSSAATEDTSSAATSPVDLNKDNEAVYEDGYDDPSGSDMNEFADDDKLYRDDDLGDFSDGEDQQKHYEKYVQQTSQLT